VLLLGSVLSPTTLVSGFSTVSGCRLALQLHSHGCPIGHIEWHLEAGLAFTLIEAPLEMQNRAQTLGPPSFMNDQCSALGLPFSGNAAGHASATDLSGLRTGPFPQNNGWHGKGIGAMFGCVLTAVIGMATVVWYTFGGDTSEEEMEEEAQRRLEAKERRGKLWGLLPGKSS
jgi:iron transport multicopper oxidase